MIPSRPAFQGLRTVTCRVADLPEAREWYADVLGIRPYFDAPFYVGFDVGGFELGLVPDPEPREAGGVTAYWGVNDVNGALARLVEGGATLREDVTEVGDGIRLAVVQDPFGNVLGVIENPGFRGIDPTVPLAVDRYLAQRFRSGREGETLPSSVPGALDVEAAVEAAGEAIVAAGMPEISISANEGRFLHLLARLAGARRILEIGTLGGVAALWMARALPPAPEGHLVSLEVDPGHAEVARRNLVRGGVGDRVEVRVGPALDLLPELEREILRGGRPPFDMVFIDADKEPYAEYLDLAIRMTRAGGLIVADNVVRGGRILDPETEDPSVLGIRRFNEALARDPRVIKAAIQTVGAKGHDGMAFALVLPREAG